MWIGCDVEWALVDSHILRCRFPCIARAEAVASLPASQLARSPSLPANSPPSPTLGVGHGRASLALFAATHATQARRMRTAQCACFTSLAHLPSTRAAGPVQWVQLPACYDASHALLTLSATVCCTSACHKSHAPRAVGPNSCCQQARNQQTQAASPASLRTC